MHNSQSPIRTLLSMVQRAWQNVNVALSSTIKSVSHSDAGKRLSGTVRFYNHSKGFGFIENADSGKDIFVHASGLIDKIKKYDKVEFFQEQGKKGINAVNVKIVR